MLSYIYTYNANVDDIRINRYEYKYKYSIMHWHVCSCRQMQEGGQAVAATAGGQGQVGWRADDEWMDEYRAADSRGSTHADAPSTRPGMAPEEEALIQVSS